MSFSDSLKNYNFFCTYFAEQTWHFKGMTSRDFFPLFSSLYDLCLTSSENKHVRVLARERKRYSFFTSWYKLNLACTSFVWLDLTVARKMKRLNCGPITAGGVHFISGGKKQSKNMWFLRLFKPLYFDKLTLIVFKYV